MTNPLEREILTHYWVTSGPFPRSTPHIEQIIERYLRAGLLMRAPEGHVCGNDAALRPYMEALSAVPLPRLVSGWVTP